MTSSTLIDLESTEPQQITPKSATVISDDEGRSERTIESRDDASLSSREGNFAPTKTSHVDSYPKSNLLLQQTTIDEARPLKVAVIGAGLAGILAGILLPAKVPGIELAIFEKNDDVGGTWLENVYPGVRCDIPAHVYQSTFSPNTAWSEIFAKGSEIWQYWRSLTRKYDVYKLVKLRHAVESARWNKEKSKWSLDVHNLENAHKETIDFDFLLPAIGRFNAWKLPDYPGIEDFTGHLRHTSNWDPSFDATGKNVAVIGNGASGIQVVPNLQRIANHVDHYARNKTWIAASWAGDERTFEPQPYSQDEIQSFQDPETYLKFRKELESKYWHRFRAVMRDSEENQALREKFIEIMSKRLERQPGLVDKMLPLFSPHCRRLTPGPGYLEALTEDNVDFIQTRIKRFTKTGIETTDGKHREVEAILCATGANIDFAPAFSVINDKGVDLSKAWKADGEYGFPRTYLGLASPGFPNLLFVAGPHGTGPSGTVPHSVEVQLTYYAKVLRKVSTQGIKTIVPSEKATSEFIEYCDAFFVTTVMTDDCSSWANGGRPGSRIHGHWPGSAAHATIVRREPRWEDWEYEYLSSSGNRFAYFGPGYTQLEMDETRDILSYLQDPAKIDLRDLHESWHNVP